MTDLGLAQFRNGIAALIGSDLPECINRDEYKPDLWAAWRNNPALCFLRLNDLDQTRVWEGILANLKGQ